MNKKDSDKKPIDLQPLQDYLNSTKPITLKNKFNHSYERPISYFQKDYFDSLSEPTLMPDLNTIEGRVQYLKQSRDNHYATLDSIRASKNDESWEVVNVEEEVSKH